MGYLEIKLRNGDEYESVEIDADEYEDLGSALQDKEKFISIDCKYDKKLLIHKEDIFSIIYQEK